MKKQRKNNKKIKKYAINVKISNEFLNDIESLSMLCESLSQKLLDDLKSKGYKIISKPKLIPYSDISEKAESNAYKVQVQAYYVGKKKILEGEKQ